MTSAHTVASPAPYPEFSDINYGFGWTRYSYQSHEVCHAGSIFRDTMRLMTSYLYAGIAA